MQQGFNFAGCATYFYTKNNKDISNYCTDEKSQKKLIMSYINDPNIITPDDKTVIWRYMDFSKYVDMLDSGMLYFARLDELKDLNEGSFYPFISKELKDSCQTNDQLRKTIKTCFSLNPQIFYVNCWHMSNMESAVLWKRYLKSDEGIAVKSTVGLLKEAISRCPETVLIGKVIYGHDNVKGVSKRENVENISVRIGKKQYSAFDAVLAKKESFRQEKELRAMLVAHELTTNAICNEVGVKTLIDINTLIEEVYIGPKAPKWIKNLVKRVSKKYKLKVKVIQSDIYNL